MLYFFGCINRERGNLVYLPIEIQELIFKYSFPLPYMNCNICNNIILYKYYNYILVSTQNYSIIQGKLSCSSCKI